MSLYSINSDVFEIIFKQNYDKVYQTVYFYTKDKYITEDAVQQAFVIAYNKLNQLNSKDKFAPWVISIALNESKRMLKDKNKINVTYISDFHLENSPDSIVQDIDLKEDINNILNKLNQKYSEILVLKYYADLTLQQIADLMGINLSNTKVRLHRAREAFRKLIDSNSTENIGG